MLVKTVSRCSGVAFHVCFFFQAEDGIRYLVRSRGLGDVYKRQVVGGGGVAFEMLVDKHVVKQLRVFLLGYDKPRQLSLIHI